VESPAASICAAGSGRDRRIALTVDDGPAAFTETVLAVLSTETERVAIWDPLG
jgi:peptidoglycan/xylan/chitin deacetylase (PgdA/CDA1 family)